MCCHARRASIGQQTAVTCDTDHEGVSQLVDGGLVPAYVREAVRRAEEERPGTSHIELPEDVARQQARHTWLRQLPKHCLCLVWCSARQLGRLG